jgi:hypothetical protein
MQNIFVNQLDDRKRKRFLKLIEKKQKLIRQERELFMRNWKRELKQIEDVKRNYLPLRFLVTRRGYYE